MITPPKTVPSADFLNLHLESMIDRELSMGRNRILVSGSSSSLLLGMLLSNTNYKEFNKLPHLVVTSSSSDAWRLLQAIQFFDSQKNAEVLSSFEISPYSGLEPKIQAATDRIRFLYKAQNARPGDLFIAPIEALLQKTLPFKVLQENCFHFRQNQDFPANVNLFLQKLGYHSSPLVEDVGQYSLRGGIIDIFSPAHSDPIRIELFGEQIESLRTFSAQSQRSLQEISNFQLIPCREALFSDENLDDLLEGFRKSWAHRDIDKEEAEDFLRALSRQQTFPGLDFLLPYFYKNLASPLDHFSTDLNVWFLDPLSISRESDQFLAERLQDYSSSSRQVIRPEVYSLFHTQEQLPWPSDSRFIEFSSLETESPDFHDSNKFRHFSFSSGPISDLSNQLQAQAPGTELWLHLLKTKLNLWKEENFRIFIGVRNQSQAERLKLLLEKIDWNALISEPSEELWQTWFEEQSSDKKQLRIIPRILPESLRIPEEKIIFLRDEDLLGKKQRLRETSRSEDFQKKA